MSVVLHTYNLTRIHIFSVLHIFVGSYIRDQIAETLIYQLLV
jgi:hypothetical protein